MLPNCEFAAIASFATGALGVLLGNLSSELHPCSLWFANYANRLELSEFSRPHRLQMKSAFPVQRDFALFFALLCHPWTQNRVAQGMTGHPNSGGPAIYKIVPGTVLDRSQQGALRTGIG